MKIYIRPKAILLIRFTIKKKGSVTEHITVLDSQHQECCDMVERIISFNESLFPAEEKTTVSIRESIGSWNGKLKTVTSCSLDPAQLKKYISNEIMFNEYRVESSAAPSNKLPWF